MAVQYQRGNYALQTLVAERIARWGKPARYSEYVSGYGTGGITGHNADINGVVHAVDIFVGPGNLTQAQGIELAEILRAEGKRGKIPGHPDRLAYIIHRGQIAGDHTGWEWIPYTGEDWHGDHIHISSVFDYYWGDRVAGDPLDYDNTSTWGLAGASTTTKPLGTTKPTPIQEDEFTVSEVNKLIAIATENQVRITQTRDQAKLNYRVAVETQKRVTETLEIAKEIAKQTGVTIDLTAIEAAATAGVAKALADGVALDATVTIKADK